MENPWTALPHDSLVLPDDRPHVEAFNSLMDGVHPKYKIDTSVVPQPFLGLHDSPLVILALNPGKADWGDDYADAVRENLTIPGGVSFPALREEFAATEGRWWRKSLRPVAEAGGVSLESLGDHVLAVEFFPYHSDSYRAMPITLPSQWFSFHLVRRAVDRGALVVLLRGVSRWSVAVPELSGKNVLKTSNPQSGVLSEANFEDPRSFARIVSRIEAAVEASPDDTDPALVFTGLIAELTERYPGIDASATAGELRRLLLDQGLGVEDARREFIRLASSEVPPIAESPSAD